MTEETRMNRESVEILRSDMNREFAELRGEMNLGFEQVNTRFAELRGEMDVRFDQVNTKFAEIDGRFHKQRNLTIYATLALLGAVLATDRGFWGLFG